MRIRYVFVVLWLLFLPVFSIAAASPMQKAHDLPNIAANDNRASAGELRDGVLTVHLEIAQGRWHPWSETGPAVSVYALREVGHALQDPGPLLRMPEGTQVHATIHNTLPVSAQIHGWHTKPGDAKDTFTVPPGATREVQFKAGAPGTYHYWATTAEAADGLQEPVDSQLVGALVIDAAGTAPADRVFVITLRGADDSAAQIKAINGKSWPYTEHFTFDTGETVHWRWVNASDVAHAMHLHGFYYYLDAVGDAEQRHRYDPAARPMVVTHRTPPGETFDMTWSPARAGRWLFHCHMLVHMTPSEPAPGATPAAAHDHAQGDAPESAGMDGLVLGITVREKRESKPVAWHPERKLQLVISERDTGAPLYALALLDSETPARQSAEAPQQPAAPPPAQLIGPPIVLTRGQPVEIEVVNRLREPTGIHWHGIELESYYDGVPGWAGDGQQTAPAIAPGTSFIARMTPPRAGTFIYHTHWHDRLQLNNGIYGPLIVLPPGQTADPAHDITFLFSMGTFPPLGTMLLVNGVPQPDPIQLKTRTKYRFRLINIAPDNVAMRASLRLAGTPVQWRAIAKDGADLPAALAVLQTAELAITVGETFDFEYSAAEPQELSLESYLPGPKLRATQALVFVPERPPKSGAN